jgi:hypothetical protein
MYEGRELVLRELDKLMHTRQGEVVPHNRLETMLALILENEKLCPSTPLPRD